MKQQTHTTMNSEKGYQQMISTIIVETGNIGVDPRHVEGWMRSNGRPTLDHLSHGAFRREAISAIECAKIASNTTNELFAEWAGLTKTTA